MKQKETWYILFICISIISSNSLSQHASFQGLGDFPGGEFNSSAQKVSADGSVIIGYGTNCFRRAGISMDRRQRNGKSR